MNEFQNEWTILHSDIEKYERGSLIIKLAGILICAAALAFNIDKVYSIVLICILWLQDGIWKTFQKRLEARIIFIEQAMQDSANNVSNAFQLYSQWELKRQGVTALITEYLLTSMKPTVAYPYVLLVSFIITILLGIF